MNKELKKIIDGKRCFIFDLDGTIADSERLHWVAHNAILKKRFNIEVDLEHIYSYLGKPESIFLKEIERDYNIDIGGPKGKGYDKYIKERNKYALKLICKEASPFRYVKDVLGDSLGIKVVLVSAQNKMVITKMLESFGLTGMFQRENTFVCDDTKTKPYYYDEVFKALKNAKPEEVVLFEDVNKYLREAKNRGFKTVGIKNGFGNEELEADYVLDVRTYE